MVSYETDKRLFPAGTKAKVLKRLNRGKTAIATGDEEKVVEEVKAEEKREKTPTAPPTANDQAMDYWKRIRQKFKGPGARFSALKEMKDFHKKAPAAIKPAVARLIDANMKRLTEMAKTTEYVHA